MQAYIPEVVTLEVIGPHAIRIGFDDGRVRTLTWRRRSETGP